MLQLINRSGWSGKSLYITTSGFKSKMILMLLEQAGKNLHLEHIEDEILNFGVPGGRGAINFVRSLRDMLSGNSRSEVNMTVKWDKLPAIFAGQDPSDGKFFVAKKSVFNVNPKLYKSNAEIDADLSGDLNAKFKVALAEFSKLNIKGVLQGDLMFTDLDTDTIDGVKYYTFNLTQLYMQFKLIVILVKL